LQHITNTFVIQVFLPESQDRPCSVTSQPLFFAMPSAQNLIFVGGGLLSQETLIAHRIRVWYIITYIFHTNQPNVGIYIPYMDGMGSVEKDFPSDF